MSRYTNYLASGCYRLLACLFFGFIGLSIAEAAIDKKPVKKSPNAASAKVTAAKVAPSKSSVAKKSVKKASLKTSPAPKKVKKNNANASKKIAKSAPKQSKKTKKKTKKIAVVRAPEPLSFARIAGLDAQQDPLHLKSSVALVVDQETHEILVKKNENAVLPIASLTKLMSGIIVTDADLPGDEIITITQSDVDTEKGSHSRLLIGSALSRNELLHLALMSSENRAAHALARTYPGGVSVFVALMNAKAQSLGMKDTRFVEPTGLSSNNQSSARDLAILVDAAYAAPQLRQLTTSQEHQVEVGHKTLQYNNTNVLVKNPEWQIGIQKTGYIAEAGRCLVMQVEIAGRKLIMVFLDSTGKLSRFGDAERVRQWLETRATPNLNAVLAQNPA